VKAERRREDRFTINREFRKVDADTLSYVSNISESGVFINTTEPIPIGTLVDLKFTVLLDEPVIIEGPGKVVYHSEDPMGIGVEFAVLPAQMALRVADIVSQQHTRRRGKVSRGPRIRTRDLTPEELAELEEDTTQSTEPPTVPPPPPTAAAQPEPELEPEPAEEPEYIDL